MKNWWSDSYLNETCGNFHCKHFTMYGCKHPYVKGCKNGSLYWPWDVNNDTEEVDGWISILDKVHIKKLRRFDD